jgi:hypothetical protein
MWITALNTSGVDRTNLPGVDEANQYRSAFGGYAPDDKAEYAKQLAEDIMRRRLHAVPEAELDRRHEAFVKREMVHIAKKKKAAPVPRAVTPEVVMEDQSWTEVCMRKHMKTKSKAKRSEGSTEPFSMDVDDPEDKPGPSGAKRPKEDADPEKGYFTRAAAAAAVEHEVEDEFADPEPEPEKVNIPDMDELLESDDENNNA